MKTQYLLLILAIIVIIVVYVQKKKQGSSVATNSPSILTSIEKYTTTPNQLLSADANGNLSIVPVSSVISPSLSNNFDDSDPTKLILNNVNLTNSTPNRNMDISSTNESIYLMGKKGTVVSANAGSGNLIVQGSIQSDGGFTCGNSGSPQDMGVWGNVYVDKEIYLNKYGGIRSLIAQLRADVNRLLPIANNLDQGKLQLGPNLTLMATNNDPNQPNGTNQFRTVLPNGKYVVVSSNS